MTKIEPNDYVLAYWIITSKTNSLIVRVVQRAKGDWQMESEFYNRYTHITTKVHDTVLQLEPQPANPDDAYYQAAHRVEDAYIKFRNAVMLSFPVFSDKTLEIEAALKDKSFRDTYARATRKL